MAINAHTRRATSALRHGRGLLRSCNFDWTLIAHCRIEVIVMVSSELLSAMCCPETHQTLRPAEPSLIEQLNQRIATGMLRNRAGQLVTERLEAGLVRSDEKVLYPIRRIPVMLVDEAIPLGG
jgi:uncharacterized protein YbaR (Trm112 family)